MVVREFCDVWCGHVSRSEWKIRIEGVEDHPPNIDIYHKFFYDKIHTGDFRKIYSQLEARWSVSFLVMCLNILRNKKEFHYWNGP